MVNLRSRNYLRVRGEKHDIVTSRTLSQSEVGEKLGQSRQRIRYSLNRAAAL